MIRNQTRRLEFLKRKGEATSANISVLDIPRWATSQMKTSDTDNINNALKMRIERSVNGRWTSSTTSSTTTTGEWRKVSTPSFSRRNSGSSQSDLTQGKQRTNVERWYLLEQQSELQCTHAQSKSWMHWRCWCWWIWPTQRWWLPCSLHWKSIYEKGKTQRLCCGFMCSWIS